MPYYDLYCTSCDKEFKLSATMADMSEKRIVCPDCGSQNLKTIFKTAPAYIKGSKPECPNKSSSCAMGCPHAG